jgi:hypothetical protein
MITLPRLQAKRQKFQRQKKNAKRWDVPKRLLTDGVRFIRDYLNVPKRAAQENLHSEF